MDEIESKKPESKSSLPQPSKTIRSRFLFLVGYVLRIWCLVVGAVVSFFGFALAGMAVMVAFLIPFDTASQLTGEKVPSQTLGESEEAILRLNLNAPITSVASGNTGLLSFLDEQSLSLQQLTTTLRRAAKDPRIKGLQIEIGNVYGNLQTFNELRDLLDEFRASEKPISLWMPASNTQLYYLASVADKIYMSPEGSVELIGPSFQLTYMGSALEKLGLKLEVVKAGKYKGAMEPMVADQPSAASLEVYGSIEENIRGHLVEAIAKSRDKPFLEVRSWMKKSLYTADKAVAAGIIDQLLYREAFTKAFHSQLGIDKVIDWTFYLGMSDKLDETVTGFGQDSIALIEAVGQIMMDDNSMENVIAPSRISKRLKWAAESEDIKAVILRISSPGGSALASDIIWQQIKDLAKIKPVVVSMADVAASGGYYIAAGASKIIAAPTTITGSIGVISAIPNGTGLSEKFGLNFYTVTQSDRKQMINFGSPMSDQDKAVLAETSDAVYQAFINKVAEGRNMPVAKVDKLSQGRVYTGIEAHRIGLVDRLGGLKTAYQEAKKLAKLQEHLLYPVVRYRNSNDLMACLQLPSEAMLHCLKEIEGVKLIPSKLISMKGRILGMAGGDNALVNQALKQAEQLIKLVYQEPHLAILPGIWNQPLQ